MKLVGGGGGEITAVPEKKFPRGGAGGEGEDWKGREWKRRNWREEGDGKG